jgi:hypothetical protein
MKILLTTVIIGLALALGILWDKTQGLEDQVAQLQSQQVATDDSSGLSPESHQKLQRLFPDLYPPTPRELADRIGTLENQVAQLKSQLMVTHASDGVSRLELDSRMRRLQQDMQSQRAFDRMFDGR